MAQLISACVLMLSVVSSSFAQNQDDNAMQSALEYVRATNMFERTWGNANEEAQMFADWARNEYPNLTDEQGERIKSLFIRHHEESKDDLERALAVVMVNNYTPEQLASIAAFFSSDAGLAFTAKRYVMHEEITDVGGRLNSEFFARMTPELFEIISE
ncbi:DUF2059 domain-containing protein [Woodsholea maritima]|uniref:DUF2059 domain-containing protein n=1 Tax=Woodsholea maritima TaxID=240237 RepID=UPI0003794FC3|nr:DUF2059 domain-containing protein [Woodsholea maritima]